MVFSTLKMIQAPVSVTLIQTGLETQTIESQLQVTYFCSLEEQSHGRARNRDVLPCQLLKRSILRYPALLRSQSGSGS